MRFVLLIYYILTLSLTYVGIGFFPIQHNKNDRGLACRSWFSSALLLCF